MIATETRRVDYIDKDGIKRRVLIPVGVTDLSEGIPISLPVDSLYYDCSIEFRRLLIDELWARGVIEPCDFKKAGAGELITAALRSAVRHDALDIISLANQECTGNGN